MSAITNGQNRMILVGVMALLVLAGCSTSPTTQSNNSSRQQQASDTSNVRPDIPQGAQFRTLSQPDKWQLQIQVSNTPLPTTGKFQFSALKCGGTYHYTGRGSNGEIVLHQNMEYGSCVRGCKLVLNTEMTTYREECNQRITGSGYFGNAAPSSGQARQASPIVHTAPAVLTCPELSRAACRPEDAKVASTLMCKAVSEGCEKVSDRVEKTSERILVRNYCAIHMGELSTRRDESGKILYRYRFQEGNAVGQGVDDIGKAMMKEGGAISGLYGLMLRGMGSGLNAGVNAGKGGNCEAEYGRACQAAYQAWVAQCKP